MRRIIILTIGLVAALGTLGALALGVAQAQYPPPTGNLTLRAETTTPPLGGVLGISATARDQRGAAVAGVACTFAIISQPGTDAGVEPGPFVTDASGVANTTLRVGSTPGNIVVGANCGDLTSQVLVAAGGAAAPGLPATGQGPEGSDKPGRVLGGVLGGLAFLTFGLGFRRAIARRGRRAG